MTPGFRARSSRTPSSTGEPGEARRILGPTRQASRKLGSVLLRRGRPHLAPVAARDLVRDEQAEAEAHAVAGPAAPAKGVEIVARSSAGIVEPMLWTTSKASEPSSTTRTVTGDAGSPCRSAFEMSSRSCEPADRRPTVRPRSPCSGGPSSAAWRGPSRRSRAAAMSTRLVARRLHGKLPRTRRREKSSTWSTIAEMRRALAITRSPSPRRGARAARVAAERGPDLDGRERIAQVVAERGEQQVAEDLGLLSMGDVLHGPACPGKLAGLVAQREPSDLRPSRDRCHSVRACTSRVNGPVWPRSRSSSPRPPGRGPRGERAPAIARPSGPLSVVDAQETVGGGGRPRRSARPRGAATPRPPQPRGLPRAHRARSRWIGLVAAQRATRGKLRFVCHVSTPVSVRCRRRMRMGSSLSPLVCRSASALPVLRRGVNLDRRAPMFARRSEGVAPIGGLRRRLDP